MCRGGRQLTGDNLENQQNQTRPQKCKQTFFFQASLACILKFKQLFLQVKVEI